MWSEKELAEMAAHIRSMCRVMGDRAPCNPNGPCYREETYTRWVQVTRRKGYNTEEKRTVFKCECGLGRVSWVFDNTKYTCNATYSAVCNLADRIEKAKPYKQFDPKNFKV